LWRSSLRSEFLKGNSSLRAGQRLEWIKRGFSGVGAALIDDLEELGAGQVLAAVDQALAKTPRAAVA